MKVALFHDFLVQMGGAEKVTEVLHQTLPHADLHTTLAVQSRLTPYLKTVPLRTTWMQHLPAKKRLFRHYFMLYPLAVESADLSEYDVVISSCFGFAKGVRRRPGALHVCYCHNPMRWVWRTTDYLEKEQVGSFKRGVIKLALKPLRAWERRAARQPDFFIANSHVVARRLRDAFGVEAVVIPPPIDTDRFEISPVIGDFFLILARLAPYKHLDLAIEACNRLQLPLVVIGDGQDRDRLESLAGPTVTFLGRQPDAVVNQYARECRALLFPGEEDFGMAPLEINAAGRPVIAFHGGGAVETIQEGLNGLFFHEHTVESITDALQRFEKATWDPQQIRRHAELYDTRVFQQKILDYLATVVELDEELEEEESSAA